MSKMPTRPVGIRSSHARRIFSAYALPLGRNQGVAFTGGSSRRGVRVPTGVPVGSGVQVGGGGGGAGLSSGKRGKKGSG